MGSDANVRNPANLIVLVHRQQPSGRCTASCWLAAIALASILTYPFAKHCRAASRVPDHGHRGVVDPSLS